ECTCVCQSMIMILLGSAPFPELIVADLAEWVQQGTPLPACGDRSPPKAAGEGLLINRSSFGIAPHPDPLPASGEREPVWRGRYPQMRYHVLQGFCFAACARSAASSTSVPQPGPVGSTISPVSTRIGCVRSFCFHGTSSTSSSPMRKLG